MIVGGSKCAFAGGEHGPCEGRLEFHHCVKQQRLKREFKYGAIQAHPFIDPPSRGNWKPANRYTAPSLSLDDILGDTRNRVWLCQAHHERVTNGRLKVELPDSVWEFAREFGLVGMLENDLRRAA